MGPVIVIAILLAFGYFFLIRPARSRSRAHEAMQSAIVVGDEIISAGGIHGIVEEAGEDELRVEIAPAVVVTLDRRAVAAVAVLEELDEEPLEPAETEDPSGPEPDAEAELDAS
jgi:preprotein translocase subunit YajC